MVSKEFFDAFGIDVVQRVVCPHTPYILYVLMPSKEVIGYQLGSEVVDKRDKGRVWVGFTFRQWEENNRRATFRDRVLGRPHYVEREDKDGDA